jgi:hypothetical protein
MAAQRATRAGGRELVSLRRPTRPLSYAERYDRDRIRNVQHARLLSALLAVAASVGSSALAQAPMPSPVAPSPAHPPATSAAPGQPQTAPAPPPDARVVRPRDVTVISGSRFRVGKETYQVFGVRTPRPRVGQCVYERLRGRQSRAALRRILSRGDIHIAPTGQLNQLGDKMARVSVDGQSVARRLVAARVAIVRRPGQNYNPWCLSLRRPPV